MYIPSAPHIYADYTTGDSGASWRGMRDQQIASKTNARNAMIALSSELKLSMLDLVPHFEIAAKEGKMLYEPFNSHWNAEGREIAARFVASALKSASGVAPVSSANNKRGFKP